MYKATAMFGFKLSSQKASLSEGIRTLLFWYINYILLITTWKSMFVHLKFITILLACA